MDDFTLFIFGVIITLVAGMGVITSEVFLGYHKYMNELKEKIPEIEIEEDEEDDIIESIV